MNALKIQQKMIDPVSSETSFYKIDFSFKNWMMDSISDSIRKKYRNLLSGEFYNNEIEPEYQLNP